jgi:beta-glucosidase
MGVPPVPEMELTDDLTNKMASETDIALITIGRNSGEGSDRKEEGDFTLSNTEKSMIKTICQSFHAKGKKVVVILNIGGVIETVSWRDLPDAILLAWQPGQEAGNSIADVISGKMDPSGKLAVTFPVKYQDVSSAKNFPGIELIDPNAPKDTGSFSFMRGKPAEVVYEEGIYVGYRYYDTYDVPAAYEFGYGLSYTHFDYGNLKLSSKNFADNLTVSVDVKNSGKVPGKEVVEVYLSAPKEKLDKPEKELKTFAKTKLLKPGESQTLSFVINPRDLASFNTENSSWVADAGKYYIKVGSSSKDIGLIDSFVLASDIKVKTDSKALSPSRQINELHGK